MFLGMVDSVQKRMQRKSRLLFLCFAKEKENARAFSPTKKTARDSTDDAEGLQVAIGSAEDSHARHAGNYQVLIRLYPYKDTAPIIRIPLWRRCLYMEASAYINIACDFVVHVM